MPASPEDLFAYLDTLGIVNRTVEHEPLFTVEDGRALHAAIPGLHCKNLFLKDKKGGLWLIVLPCDLRADLNALAKRLEAPRLSFGSADMLLEVLGITPGSVSPFALINDTARRVTVVLDATMMASAQVNYHPLRNNASTCIAASDLVRFIESLGYAPRILDCGL